MTRPKAVWEGVVLGMRAYVLDDGRRIFHSDDLGKFVEMMARDDFDPVAFVEEYQAFMSGKGTPQ